MTEIDIVIRLGVAMLCGAAIGIEREYFKHPAGMRTFSLVCLAAALAMVVQMYICGGNNELVKADPGRIAAQVLTGIGFIGAGLIIKNRDSISGLTTAACIFLTSVIGLAIGAGMILTGVFTTVASIVLLASTQLIKRAKSAKEAKEGMVGNVAKDALSSDSSVQ